MAYYIGDQSNMISNSAPTQNLSSIGQGYQWTLLPYQQFHQQQQLAAPLFWQQNCSQPYEFYQPQLLVAPLFAQQNSSQPREFYQPQLLAAPLFVQQNSSQPREFYQPQLLAAPLFVQQNCSQPREFYQPQLLAAPLFGQQNCLQPIEFYQPQLLAAPLFGQQNCLQPIEFHQPQLLAAPLFRQQNCLQPIEFHQPQLLATPQQNSSQPCEFLQPQLLAAPLFWQQNSSQPIEFHQPQHFAAPLFWQQNSSQPCEFYQPQLLATPQQNSSQPCQFCQPQQLVTPLFVQQDSALPCQFCQPQQLATPSYSQQYPQQWQHGHQPATQTELEDRTNSATSGLTVGPERPKWYYKATQKNGAAYADKLWENVVQKMRENEVRKKMQEVKIAEERRAVESKCSVETDPGAAYADKNVMQKMIEDEVRKHLQEMKITERRRGAENMPSVETEPGDDERVASVTEDLRLGPKEDTTRSQDAGHVPDLQKYKMDRLPRGVCIIFNAENFATKSNLKKRLGTQKDVEALLNTFHNNLKFKTYVQEDPTAREYVDCLQQIARLDHSKFDCFVCVILSHGCKGRVFGTDGEMMSIDDLTGLFRGNYVPSLVNKPKLFFIQACRGALPQESIDIQEDAPATLPNESDTLVSQATVPGYASCRSANRGSLFISSLCNIINTNYKKVDLLSMLTMVNERMSHRALKGHWKYIGKQIGNPSHTLRKQIFFNLGLDD